VFDAGVTVTVPVNGSLPTLLSIFTVLAPVTVHESVELPPVGMDCGEAAKVMLITAGGGGGGGGVGDGVGVGVGAGVTASCGPRQPSEANIASESETIRTFLWRKRGDDDVSDMVPWARVPVSVTLEGASAALVGLTWRLRC
jgi:hypothetical protein